MPRPLVTIASRSPLKGLHAPERLGRVEQTVNVAYAQQAGAAEGGLIDFVGVARLPAWVPRPARGLDGDPNAPRSPALREPRRARPT